MLRMRRRVLPASVGDASFSSTICAVWVTNGVYDVLGKRFLSVLCVLYAKLITHMGEVHRKIRTFRFLSAHPFK